MTTPSVNFVYRLDGDEEKIKSGLSVFELAPILLAVGDLIKESNRTLNPNGPVVRVNVKPFKEGSFIIDLLLFAGEHTQDLIDLMSGEYNEEIKKLLEAIGLISSITGISLLALIKKIKGKPKSVEQVGPNEVKYVGQEGDSLTVNRDVHQLFQNNNIQTFVYNAYGKPLEQDGIDKVDCYLENDLEKTQTVFTKEDSKYIKDYECAEIPSLNLEEVVESEMVVFLSPKRGSFDADPRQWSFRMGAQNQVITATIRDEDFLEKCKKGTIKPHHTDVLKVRLIQKVKKTNDALDLDSAVYEIKEVLDYQSGNGGMQSKID